MTSTKHRRSGRSRQATAYDDTVSCPPALDTRKKRKERFEPDAILKTLRDEDDDHSVTSEYSQYTQLTRYTQQLYSKARKHQGYGHVVAGIAIFFLLTVSHQWNVDRDAAHAASIMEELEQAKQHQESANNMNTITSVWEKRTLTNQLDQPSLRGSVIAQNHALQKFAPKVGSTPYQSWGSDVSSRVTSSHVDDGASRSLVDQGLATSILLKGAPAREETQRDPQKPVYKKPVVPDEKLIVLDEPRDKQPWTPPTVTANSETRATKLEKSREGITVNNSPAKALVASESKIVPKEQVKFVEPIKLADITSINPAISGRAPTKNVAAAQLPQKTVPPPPLFENNTRPLDVKEEAKPQDSIVRFQAQVATPPESKQTVVEQPVQATGNSVAMPPKEAETKSTDVGGSPEVVAKPDAAKTPAQPIETKPADSVQPHHKSQVAVSSQEQPNVGKSPEEVGQVLLRPPPVQDESKQASQPVQQSAVAIAATVEKKQEGPKANPSTSEMTPQKVAEPVSPAAEKPPPVVEAKVSELTSKKAQGPPAEVAAEVKAQQAPPKIEQAAVKPSSSQKPVDAKKEAETPSKKDPCTTTFNTISADGARMVAFLKLPGCKDGNEEKEGDTAMT